MAPFITVTHVDDRLPSAATCVMATKDVYSSRYLDASVALAIATDAGGPPAPIRPRLREPLPRERPQGAFSGSAGRSPSAAPGGGAEESLQTLKIQLETGGR